MPPRRICGVLAPLRRLKGWLGIPNERRRVEDSRASGLELGVVYGSAVRTESRQMCIQVDVEYGTHSHVVALRDVMRVGDLLKYAAQRLVFEFRRTVRLNRPKI